MILFSCVIKKEGFRRNALEFAKITLAEPARVLDPVEIFFLVFASAKIRPALELILGIVLHLRVDVSFIKRDEILDLTAIVEHRGLLEADVHLAAQLRDVKGIFFSV